MANGQGLQDQLVAGRLVQEGVALQNQGRPAEAEARYRRAISLAPQNIAALHLLGRLMTSTGRLTQAVQFLSQAAGLSTASADVFNDLAMVMSLLGRGDDAIDNFDRAIALRPNHFAALYNRGVALEELGRANEALASYQAAIAVKPDFAEALCNHGAILRGLGRLREALASLDQALALRPDIAEAHNSRGLVLAELGELDEAVASHERAIALKPDFADAHGNRANALHRLGRLTEALAGHDTVLGLMPDHAEAHNNRGAVLRALNRPHQAIASFNAALAINPAHAGALNNRGTSLRDIGQGDQALADYEAAIALQPDFHQAIFNKSLQLLTIGDYRQGWELYEARQKLESVLRRHDYRQPQWSGREDLAGKTVFLRWEQGFGDMIQFSRFAPLVRSRAAAVVLSVPSPLTRLLSSLDAPIEIIGPDAEPESFDLHCPVMSLPRALGVTAETIPFGAGYLRADPSLARLWRDRLGPRRAPRVGLVWSGSASHRHDHNRSIPLAELTPLLDREVEWICLQTDVRESDQAVFRASNRIQEHLDASADFADTAALIGELDLVISVDTSVAHLAGALGRPCWVLLPFMPDFRWLLGRQDSPWYASARLFRQPALGDWASVIDHVSQALTGSLAVA